MTELTPEARALKNAYAREWRRKNPGKQAEYMRKSWNKKAAYIFKTCPDCGANLDPGELCDCKGGATNEKTERQ